MNACMLMYVIDAFWRFVHLLLASLYTLLQTPGLNSLDSSRIVIDCFHYCNLQTCVAVAICHVSELVLPYHPPVTRTATTSG